jgi:hypothetical protein
MRIQISRASKVPTTAWFPNKLVFVIALPKGELPRGQTVLAGFSSDLLKLFTDSPPMGATPGDTLESAEDPEDWADLDLGSPESHPIMTPSSKQAPGPPGLSIQVGEDPIPEISTIPRPEELIRKPPYWMVVRQENRMRVVVQGSHGPSLILLDAYLKRWCRGEVARSDRVSTKLPSHECSNYKIVVANEKLKPSHQLWRSNCRNRHSGSAFCMTR